MAVALMQGLPDHRTEDEALAAFGLQRDQPVEPAAIEVWADHWPVVKLFLDLATQWRSGPAGRTGLVYESVWALLDRQPCRPRRRLHMFAQIQVLEFETLRWLAEKRNRSGRP